MDNQYAGLPESTIVSFCTFNGYEEALQHFTALYEPEYLALCPSESMIRDLKPKRERQCRFCGLRRPDTHFDTRPHVIPEMLGNKYLISDYECDTCNAAFSNLESNLAHFVGAARAIYAVEGKKLPTFKSVGDEVVIRQEEFYGVRDGTKIAWNGSDKPTFRRDKETSALEFRYLKSAYTPIKVYKALLKIALSIMPAEHMPQYAELVRLLLHDVDNRLARFATVFITRLSAQLVAKHPVPRCHLSRRISDKAKVCTHMVSLYFLDYVIELPLPLHAQDVACNLYADKDFALPLCPPLFLRKPDEVLLNTISLEEKSLAGTEPVKEEEVYSILHTADAFQNTQIYNPATGETKPSDGILPNVVAVYIARGDELPNFPQGPFNHEEKEE